MEYRWIYLLGGSRWFYARISYYITGTDRRSVRRRTVFPLMRPYNRRYVVKYPLFAQILALCRARIITNPIRQLYSCVKLSDWISKFDSSVSAMILAKSMIIVRLCSETVLPKFRPFYTFRLHRSIQHSRLIQKILFYLRN
jgi:hypothetical protein